MSDMTWVPIKDFRGFEVTTNKRRNVHEKKDRMIDSFIILSLLSLFCTGIAFVYNESNHNCPLRPVWLNKTSLSVILSNHSDFRFDYYQGNDDMGFPKRKRIIAKVFRTITLKRFKNVLVISQREKSILSWLQGTPEYLLFTRLGGKFGTDLHKSALRCGFTDLEILNCI